MSIEPFRHNSWATLRLLDFCRDLQPDLLEATIRGTYGSVKETLAHVVGTEELLASVVDGAPGQNPPRFTSVDDLQERSRWLQEKWERLLEQPLHADRVVQLDQRLGERRLVRLGTVLAQVIHHGNHHRSEVCTTLSAVDIIPPPLDGWAYGTWLVEVKDRQRRRSEGGL